MTAKPLIPFLVHEADGYPAPVVFDTPHSGTVLPDHFRYVCARDDLMHLYDPHVEKLLTGVPETGVPVLEALIHRTCIDLNRHAHESESFPLLTGPWKNRLTPIYNEHSDLTQEEADYRIQHYRQPYYAQLHALLGRAHEAHGFSLHVDVHSAKRPPGSSQMADIILGDRDGQTCSPQVHGFIKRFFEGEGFTVDKNGPYFSGRALIQSTHNARENRHSIQIEIARDIYMNQETRAFDEGKGAQLRDVMTRFAGSLHDFALNYAAAPKSFDVSKTADHARLSDSSSSGRETPRPRTRDMDVTP